MPTVNIDLNIKELSRKIEKMSQEIFRLQGVLQTFQGLKSGGLENIELPNGPNQEPVEEPVEELESIQEKPE
jgi:hypothetical protein